MEVPHYPPTGFPSPAEEWIEPSLKVENLLIVHPSTTFFMRVAGDAMVGIGIHEGDIVVVDRALAPADQQVIVAILGEICTIFLRVVREAVHSCPSQQAGDCPLQQRWLCCGKKQRGEKAEY